MPLKRKKAKSPGILLGRLRKRSPKVTQVLDATSPIKITVKDADCKDGVGSDFSECALAKATRREFKADACLIGLSYSYVIKGKTAVRYKTPQSVSREIVSFDRHHDFDTGVYHLASVPDTQKLGNSGYQRVSGYKSSKTKRNYNYHESARVRRVRETA